LVKCGQTVLYGFSGVSVPPQMEIGHLSLAWVSAEFKVNLQLEQKTANK